MFWQDPVGGGNLSDVTRAPHQRDDMVPVIGRHGLPVLRCPLWFLPAHYERPAGLGVTRRCTGTWNLPARHRARQCRPAAIPTGLTERRGRGVSSAVTNRTRTACWASRSQPAVISGRVRSRTKGGDGTETVRCGHGRVAAAHGQRPGRQSVVRVPGPQQRSWPSLDALSGRPPMAEPSAVAPARVAASEWDVLTATELHVPATGLHPPPAAGGGAR